MTTLLPQSILGLTERRPPPPAQLVQIIVHLIRLPVLKHHAQIYIIVFYVVADLTDVVEVLLHYVEQLCVLVDYRLLYPQTDGALRLVAKVVHRKIRNYRHDVHGYAEDSGHRQHLGLGYDRSKHVHAQQLDDIYAHYDDRGIYESECRIQSRNVSEVRQLITHEHARRDKIYRAEYHFQDLGERHRQIRKERELHDVNVHRKQRGRKYRGFYETQLQSRTAEQYRIQYNDKKSRRRETQSAEPWHEIRAPEEQCFDEHARGKNPGYTSQSYKYRPPVFFDRREYRYYTDRYHDDLISMRKTEYIGKIRYKTRHRLSPPLRHILFRSLSCAKVISPSLSHLGYALCKCVCIYYHSTICPKNQ